MKKRIEEQENPSFRMTMRSSESFFNIEVANHSEPKITTIRLNHAKSFFDFGFEEESDGTRRLFDLMDMLLNKREDMLYVVDELERSLHPKLKNVCNYYLQRMNLPSWIKASSGGMRYGLLNEVQTMRVPFIH